ncbi:hypothetical protein ABTY00_35730 [Streptomyces microflavus]|uniref:hypothetical protein n=1 Tax=Streptomyces microflavus TaxID=1919 RepID=UPI00331F806E
MTDRWREKSATGSVGRREDGYVLVRPAVCGVPGGTSAVVGVDDCLGDDVVVVVDVGGALRVGNEGWQVGDQSVHGYAVFVADRPRKAAAKLRTSARVTDTQKREVLNPAI